MMSRECASWAAMVAAVLLACSSTDADDSGERSAASGRNAAGAGGSGVGGSSGGAAGTGGTGGAAAPGGNTGSITGGSGGASNTTSSGGASPDSGAPAGASHVCGTADEGGVVALTCPSGDIVDAVVFASYGEPTGTCESFSAGACDATSSVSVVEDLCVGRETCTVPATNGTFSDPCQGTPKSLAVEVTCVAGAPVAPTRPFKGVANSPCDARTALGVSWYYNWGPNESEPCADPSEGGEFVPMIWGSQPAGNITSAIAGFVANGYGHVLGFNEPDHTDQANMSVDAAIALWPAFDNPSIQLVSPAAASDGQSWFNDFMTQVSSNGLRVDVVAIHWYGWNAGSCDPDAAGLENHIEWAEGIAQDRPIWITEWGCLNQSAPDEQTVLNFYQGALDVFARHPRVERYAWYPWSANCGLVNPDGALTALGQAYAAAPAYR